MNPPLDWGIVMDRGAPEADPEQERIVLSLLNSVDYGARSQRHIADELGIALGLVNAYLKRCVKKGFVKVSQAPARRYGYYLTPKGFAEKSRLTVQYLSDSFSFFRQAKADCAHALAAAKQRNFQGLALCGKSDLAEIAILSAVDCEVLIVAIVDNHGAAVQFVGKPVVSRYEDVREPFDGVMITDLVNTRRAFEEAVRRFGAERVLAPRLLGLSVPETRSMRQ
jgi:DNA-binding MarR family transcriptional regulator